MQFQSAYTVHYAGVKYAIDNHYKRYNFYGITGDFNKDNPLYGLYLFKKSFGGHVVELLGEFDLVISPFWYHSYNLAYSLYSLVEGLSKSVLVIDITVVALLGMFDEPAISYSFNLIRLYSTFLACKIRKTGT